MSSARGAPEAHLPWEFTRANCPNGYAVNGVNVYYGATLNQIASLSRANLNVPIFQTTVPVNAGSATGTFASFGCGARVVDGMFLHNGWLNDGAEMHCRMRGSPAEGFRIKEKPRVRT